MADYSGLTQKSISQDFLLADQWKTMASGDATVPSFLEFRDGILIYAVAIQHRIQMQIIHRKKTEFFRDTISGFVAGGKRLAVSGCFADNDSMKIALKKITGSSPLDPDMQDYMGIIIDSGSRLGETRPGRCFLAFSQNTGFSTGLGDPPSNSDAAIGGLGALFLNGQAFPTQNPGFERANQFYMEQRARGDLNGNCVIATSSILYSPQSFGDGIWGFQVLLILVKPHAETPGMPLDDLRDKLLNARFTNAVFLDGSDSVFWNSNGRERVSQGEFKNRITSIGLGFL